MENEQKLPLRVNWSFGVANGLMQFVYAIGGSYFAYFVSDICNLGAAVMGTVAGISSFATLAGSFLWGIIYQYSNTKFGRFRPWLVIIPVLIFMGYCLMYFNWGMNPVIWAGLIIVGYAMSNIGVQGLGVARSSLMMKVAKTEPERRFIIYIQNGIHTAVRVIGGAIVLPIIIFVGGSRSSPLGYFVYFAGFSFIAMFGYIFLNRVTKPYDTYDPNFKAGTRVTPADIIRVLAANRQLLVFFVSDFLRDLLYLCKTMGLVYFVTYICKQFVMYAVYVTLSPFVAFIVTFVVALWLRKYPNKVNLLILCFGLQALTYVFIAAWTFATGTMNMVMFIIIVLFGDFLNGADRVIHTTFYMDMAEDSYNKTGKDIAPIVMALSGLPFTFGFVAAGSIVGAVMAATGYVPNAVQTPTAINGIILAVIVIPIIGLVQFIIVLKKTYKLNPQEVKRIYAENIEKRAAAKAAAGAAS